MWLGVPYSGFSPTCLLLCNQAEKGWDSFCISLFCLYAVRSLSDFSFITVILELLPVTYPRCCCFNFLSRHLAHITDKKQIISFCCRLFFFFFAPTSSVCVCTGVYACTPQKAMMVNLFWLCLWHSCVPALSTSLPWLSQCLPLY